MQDLVKVFDNPEFGRVRTVIINDEPWFVGRDITTILEYSNPTDAIKNHVDSEDLQILEKSPNATFEIPTRGLTIINESGLYSLILSSKMPRAKEFKHWVTSEVLPSIRKTGSYFKPLSIEEHLMLSGKALLEHKQRLEAHDKHLKELDNKVDYLEKSMMKPKMYSESEWDSLAAELEPTFTTTQLAKQLGYKSAQALNKILVEKGIEKRLPDNTYRLSEAFKDSGYVEYKETSFKTNHGIDKQITLRWTVKGVDFITNILK